MVSQWSEGVIQLPAQDSAPAFYFKKNEDDVCGHYYYIRYVLRSLDNYLLERLELDTNYH